MAKGQKSISSLSLVWTFSGISLTFVQLLVPKLNKVISYQLLLILLEGQIMNNSDKIISLHGAPRLKV